MKVVMSDEGGGEGSDEGGGEGSDKGDFMLFEGICFLTDWRMNEWTFVILESLLQLKIKENNEFGTIFLWTENCVWRLRLRGKGADRYDW